MRSSLLMKQSQYDKSQKTTTTTSYGFYVSLSQPFEQVYYPFKPDSQNERCMYNNGGYIAVAIALAALALLL